MSGFEYNEYATRTESAFYGIRHLLSKALLKLRPVSISLYAASEFGKTTDLAIAWQIAYMRTPGKRQ